MMTLFCLAVVTLFCILCVSTEKVPAPEDVRVISLDMGLVLEWDPPQNSTNRQFTYTAEMTSTWENNYAAVCQSSSSLSCDFTDIVSIFGTYHLRVRTEEHGETSDWVETEVLSLDGITKISAPRIELRSSKGQTEVDITDPPLKRKSLRDIFWSISYLIRFWKKGETKKEKLQKEQNRVMLPNLEPLANYCVEVEILYGNNKTSHLSNITCITNTSSNEAEPWLIGVVLLLSFLVVLVAVVLIFLAVWYGYKGCRIMFPDAKLPEHLKQYLAQRSQSPILLAMQENTLKEHFYELKILQGEQLSGQTEDRPIIQNSEN